MNVIQFNTHSQEFSYAPEDSLAISNITEGATPCTRFKFFNCGSSMELDGYRDSRIHDYQTLGSDFSEDEADDITFELTYHWGHWSTVSTVVDEIAKLRDSFGPSDRDDELPYRWDVLIDKVRKLWAEWSPQPKDDELFEF